VEKCICSLDIVAQTNTDSAERSDQGISPVNGIATETGSETLPIRLGITEEEKAVNSWKSKSVESMSCFIYSWDGLSTALHVCELVEDRTVI
jgi:hypothetical protein